LKATTIYNLKNIQKQYKRTQTTLKKLEARYLTEIASSDSD